MINEKNNNYPVRVYLEDLGYNYVIENGILLSPKKWFASATHFDTDGHARVRFNSMEPEMIIDMDGNVIC
ncbi:MAG: hypothetical protein IKV94_02245 [Clostridia bacterium]|nr:hypothetical protein [Clostridia bacterium]